MRSFKVDVAIVGAGIIGLAHAYLAARSGLSVAVFERNPAALGASIRNFGMIWPIGQPAGPLHEMALRSRALWLEALGDASLPFRETGSLHAAYREDEAVVGEEFGRKAPSLGYDCAWLSAHETLARTEALRPEGLVGALWSPTELTVDPRQILRELPPFLSEQFRVSFHFNTAVLRVEPHGLFTAELCCEADSIVVAGGDDFQTLFPECFHSSGVTRCKLQMMRTTPQPGQWQLGPSLAFGLTFLHYPTFQVCESLAALRNRIEQDCPELIRYGIHVMVSQTAGGALTLGDSHEYGLAVNVFDNPRINQLILDHVRTHVSAPTLEIAEQWHGVYAKHAAHPWIVCTPAEGVRVVTVTSGIGMTMSFALAQQNLLEMGVIQ